MLSTEPRTDHIECMLAAKPLRKAIKIEPDDPEGHFTLAATLDENHLEEIEKNIGRL